MNFQGRFHQRKRAGRRSAFRVEALEKRALLAASAESFNLPPLQHLIVLAREGHNTANATINVVLTALESQLTAGPLADLKSGAANGNEFVTEVQNMVSSYDTAINAALLPEFPNVDTLLVLQGQRIVADESSLNQQNSVALLSDSDFPSQADAAINALTGGPLFSLHTPLTGYATATQSFEATLHNIADGLSVSAPLTPSDASLTMLAATVAYQANIHAALQVTHPHVSNIVDMAVSDLISTANAIATETSSAAQAAINSAITAFDAAILDSTGIFGPAGLIATSLETGRGFPPHLQDHRESSTLADVSGTGSSGGTATLTATLTSSSGNAIAGVPVSFTLDGAFAGVATTDSSGVATLSDVPTTAPVGTDTDGVAAFFAGNINAKSSTGIGSLTVSNATPTISTTATPASAVVGTSITDKATVSGGDNPTGTVTFNLYNNSSATGTALFTDTETLTSGTATSKGFTTTAAGTDYWVVKYSGDTNNTSVTSGNASEPVSITQASPTIATTATPTSGTVGTSITDKATVSGGHNPSGTVTFNLYNNSSGTGTALFTDTETLASRAATSKGFTTTAIGTVYWVAKYNGDNNNTSVSSGNASEPVSITQATPTIATTATPTSAVVGTSIADKVTVSGGGNPTGTATFNLYDNSSATGTPLFTDTETLASGAATSKGFTTTATGTVYWVVKYSGDTNNTSVTSGNASEPVSITQASPTIATTATPTSGTVGTSIADKATVSGGDNPTGTVTFTLYNNSSATGTALFTDTETLASGTATSANFTTVASGTVYWVATYNGDSNNALVRSTTDGEPVVIS
jgi:hypothetical protein